MKPIRILFDTDIGGDCDDAGALAMLHRLIDLGEAELLAVTHCFGAPFSAGCIDAINTYFGHVVPVGIHRGTGLEAHDTYARALCEEFPNRYPISAFESGEIPDTCDVMRTVLSEAEDHSVTLVVTGYLTSMKYLLQSEPDAISPLSGYELIEMKIDRTVIMGGRFHQSFPMPIYASIPENGDERAEWNIRCDIDSAKYVTENWPGRLTFASFELGNYIVTMRDYAKTAPSENPVGRAYALHSPNGRQSWDHTAMLEAVRPGVYWNYHESGRVHVHEDGVTELLTGEGTQDYLLPKADYETIRAAIDSLLLDGIGGTT